MLSSLPLMTFKIGPSLHKYILSIVSSLELGPTWPFSGQKANCSYLIPIEKKNAKNYRNPAILEGQMASISHGWNGSGAIREPGKIQDGRPLKFPTLKGTSSACLLLLPRARSAFCHRPKILKPHCLDQWLYQNPILKPCWAVGTQFQREMNKGPTFSNVHFRYLQSPNPFVRRPMPNFGLAPSRAGAFCSVQWSPVKNPEGQNNGDLWAYCTKTCFMYNIITVFPIRCILHSSITHKTMAIIAPQCLGFGLDKRRDGPSLSQGTHSRKRKAQSTPLAQPVHFGLPNSSMAVTSGRIEWPFCLCSCTDVIAVMGKQSRHFPSGSGQIFQVSAAEPFIRLGCVHVLLHQHWWAQFNGFVPMAVLCLVAAQFFPLF